MAKSRFNRAFFYVISVQIFFATAAVAQPRKGFMGWLFHKVIEGKPMPVSRIGPDKDLKTPGFAVYRQGNGHWKQYRQLVCDIGVTQIVVLSGNGTEELAYNQRLKTEPCLDKNGKPDFTKKGLEVLYGDKADDVQWTKDPLSENFLKKYDKWLGDAKLAGTKIVFRCDCGCHRTGRLAGYTDMKFFGATADQAIHHMKDAFHEKNAKGKFFASKYAKRTLKHQVRALEDYIHYQKALETNAIAGQTSPVPIPPRCQQDDQYCVQVGDGIKRETKKKIAAPPVVPTASIASTSEVEAHLDQVDADCSAMAQEPKLEDGLNAWGDAKNSCDQPFLDDDV